MGKKQKSSLVSVQVVREMGNVLTQLQNIFRWSSFIADDRYTELGKQTLNAIISYFMALEADNEGFDVDMSLFPKIIINRMYEKLFLCDIREDYLAKIFELGNIERKVYKDAVQEQIRKGLGKDFAEFIQYDKDCLEARIFQGATKVATLLELGELECLIRNKEVSTASDEIKETLKGYSDLPGFDKIINEDSNEISNEFELFQKVSDLRNRIRWQKRICAMRCSVLGHCFETGIISYLMALYEYGEGEIVGEMFFAGIFHDVAEALTGDIAKPIKDSIQGLRRASELFELKKIKENFYDKLPEYLVDGLKAVMLEEPQFKVFKTIIKKADYMSALWE